MQYGLEGVRPYPAEFTALPNWADPWPSPFHANVAAVGYGGIGIDWEHAAHLRLVLPFVLAWVVLRWATKRWFFPWLARALGIPPANKKRTRKFAYQGWLLCFYTASTAFGYAVQRHQGWLGFPQSKENQMALFADFPTQPDDGMVFYYNYELAFFISELIAIFLEDRRSDFIEYAIHHITSIVLVLMSFLGHDHPMGAWILLLHDASDIFLCAAKAAHYCAFEKIVNTCFVVFIASFVYLRLYCLPVNFIATFYVAPLVRKATVNYWVLTFLLYGVLQPLHLYWFYLIVRIVLRLIRGVKGDARSDSDNDESDKVKKKLQHKA